MTGEKNKPAAASTTDTARAPVASATSELTAMRPAVRTSSCRVGEPGTRSAPNRRPPTALPPAKRPRAMPAAAGPPLPDTTTGTLMLMLPDIVPATRADIRTVMNRGSRTRSRSRRDPAVRRGCGAISPTVRVATKRSPPTRTSPAGTRRINPGEAKVRAMPAAAGPPR